MPLTQIIANDYDGRTKTGFNRSIDRLSRRPENATKLALRKNYMKLIKIAEQLQERNLQILSDEELKGFLLIMQRENVQLPPCLLRALLARRIAKCLNVKGSAEELLFMVSPFGVAIENCNPWELNMNSLEEPMGWKLQQCQKAVYDRVLTEAISGGEAEAQATLSFVEKALVNLDEVDVVELEPHVSKTVSEWVGVLRGVKALIDSKCGKEYEVAGHTGSGRFRAHGLTGRTERLAYTVFIHTSTTFETGVKAFYDALCLSIVGTATSTWWLSVHAAQIRKSTIIVSVRVFRFGTLDVDMPQCMSLEIAWVGDGSLNLWMFSLADDRNMRRESMM